MALLIVFRIHFSYTRNFRRKMNTITNTPYIDSDLDNVWAERKRITNNSYLTWCSICDESIYLPYKSTLEGKDREDMFNLLPFQIKFVRLHGDSWNLDFDPLYRRLANLPPDAKYAGRSERLNHHHNV